MFGINIFGLIFCWIPCVFESLTTTFYGTVAELVLGFSYVHLEFPQIAVAVMVFPLISFCLVSMSYTGSLYIKRHLIGSCIFQCFFLNKGW